MGKFEKGHEKIPGSGAKKGVQSKNKELREMIRDFALNKYDDAIAAFDRISNPKDKFDSYCKMLRYLIPTVSAIKFEDAKEASTAVELLRIAAQYQKE